MGFGLGLLTGSLAVVRKLIERPNTIFLGDK
jgi:hypothetical protein